MRQIRYIYLVGTDAFYTFLADDGWAIASHIALSTLMALFPFLIVLTSLAGFFGSKELADQAAELMLQIWPAQVANALSGEIHDVLTTTRGDALTVGAVFAVYFASNGVESLRVALNRAYAVIEIAQLVLAAAGIDRLYADCRGNRAGDGVPDRSRSADYRRREALHPADRRINESLLNLARYGITGLAMFIALVILHAWLPSGRRSFLQIIPGIIFTMLASLVSGIGFGLYLARFANNYVTMYAGLASVVIALVFLYFIAAIFVFGGELNAAIIKSRLPRGVSLQAAQSLKPEEDRLDQKRVRAGGARCRLVVASAERR